MRENNRNDKRNFERRDGKKRDFKGKRDYRDRDRKQEVQQADEEFTGGMVEGRNAVIEAFRSGKTVDKLFVLASSQDGPIRTIIREAKKHDTIINYVEKERLDELSTTGKHQGVIAQVASYSYATVEDILARAEEKGEPPFILLLDGIEDPHNLGAIIRTANLAGAHGVIVPKHRAVGLTATVAKTSAGALNYTPVAKVTNLVQTMEMLKEKGIEPKAMGVEGTEKMTQDEYRKAAIDAVKKLAADVGIPSDLKDIVKPEDISFLAQSAYDDACRPGNPRETSVEEITKLYESLI